MRPHRPLAGWLDWAAVSSSTRGDGFADPWNPTAAELVTWAHSDRPHPVEDWDLVLASPEHAPVVLALAADTSCPRRGFLLDCLETLVREAASRGRAEEVTPLVDAVRRAGTPTLALWVARATLLLEGAPGAVKSSSPAPVAAGPGVRDGGPLGVG